MPRDAAVAGAAVTIAGGAVTAPAPITSAVILAAGRSSRMEGPHKLLLDLGGQPLLRHVVKAVLGAEPADVVVVTGYRAAEVTAALDGLPVRFAHNAGYAQGQQASVVAGMRALTAACDVLMVALGDQPLLTTANLRGLINGFCEMGKGKSILIPTWQGRRGNPVLFAARHIPDIATGLLHRGCRDFIDTNPEMVARIEMDDDAFVLDCDTPADYAAMRARYQVAVQ
jgi:molybdenum cofactor cytidylyltransferase